MKTALYWFRYDLRLHDNPGWAQMVAEHPSALGVFVLPQRWFELNPYQCESINPFRLGFLLESLIDLRRQLRACGSELIVLRGDPGQLIPGLVAQLNIAVVGVGQHPGSDERDDIARAQKQLNIPLNCYENFTLFNRAELPFKLEELPAVFFQFRKRIEPLPAPSAIPAPENVRQSPPLVQTICLLDQWYEAFNNQHLEDPKHPYSLTFSGGSQSGIQQLHYFLHGSHKIATYKETRNQLDGWDFSSKLSPWLALGCISARQVAEAIGQYETQYQANKSTYWLYFELLWREYFQWLALRYGKKMFALRGIQNKDPNLTFCPEKFNAWRRGETNNEFINAFMRQLLHTGWMSNRGRQIVASYLINEMGIDWRYGAAWFEQQLIDYDVAANWGNWQYLAGVGTDPRGRRQFNIEKQRQTYDPDELFIKRWAGKANSN